MTPTALALTATARRDTRGVVKVTVTPRLVLPSGAPATACSGVVSITVKRGKKVLGRASATLKSVRGGCTGATKKIAIAAKQRVKKGAKLSLQAGYPGTVTTAPIAARATTVKVR